MNAVQTHVVLTSADARRFDAVPIPWPEALPTGRQGLAKHGIFRALPENLVSNGKLRHRWIYASKNGRPVGRLVAAMDPERRSGGAPLGLFGGLVLPRRDPQSVATALLAEARKFWAEQGALRFEGPSARAAASSGPLLLHGEQAPEASASLGFTPLAWAEVLSQAGLKAAAELYGYRLTADNDLCRRLWNWSRAARDQGFELKSIGRSELAVDLARAKRFPPGDADPMALMVSGLAAHPLSFRKGFALRLERRGVCLGYGWGMPEVAPLLKRFQGRIPTTSALLVLRFRREIERLRLLAPLLAPVGLPEGLDASLRCLLFGGWMRQMLRKGFRSADVGPIAPDDAETRELLAVCQAPRIAIYQTFTGEV